MLLRRPERLSRLSPWSVVGVALRVRPAQARVQIPAVYRRPVAVPIHYMVRFVFGLWIWILLTGACAAASGGILVIANPAVPVSTVSMTGLRAIYLMQMTRWPDGTPIVPVNRDSESALRDRFSHLVFDAPPRDFARYWIRLHAQGESPPLVLGSDRDVESFVAHVSGAIGYVAAPARLPGVKILRRLP